MPPAKKSAKTARAARTTPVSTVRHRDTRANIHTEELRDFVADIENRRRPSFLCATHR
jgi:hypothetical protein